MNCGLAVPVLHVWTQDARDPAFASRRQLGAEVWPVEAEGNVDSTVRGGYVVSTSDVGVGRRKRRVEEVNRILRRYGVLEYLLRGRMHDDQLCNDPSVSADHET